MTSCGIVISLLRWSMVFSEKLVASPDQVRAGPFRDAITFSLAAAEWDAMGDQLAQNFPPDRAVGGGWIEPPPAVLLHSRGRRDETVRDIVEVGIGVVVAEDQAASADPGQGEAFGTQIRSEEHTSELQSLRHLVCRL